MRGKRAPLSLYFHFPYCRKKCPYCHFYVIPKSSSSLFLEALEREWELRLPQIEGRELVSLYFGGGTPTLFMEGILSILGKVRAPEITVETNPDEVSPALAKALAELGVNRVSLGAQSFDNSLLKKLGREHSAQQTIEALFHLKEAGIDNLSIDLMYEIPYQSVEIWEATLKTATSLPITHLSLYNLTIEPHTLFYKQKEGLTPHLPSEESGAQMLTLACEQLEEAGLRRYEISAFARAEKCSVHNLGYWTGREFLGLGPSAWSYMGGERFQNIPHLGRYIRSLKEGALPLGEKEQLPFPASLHEALAIGLRVLSGVALPPSLPRITTTLIEELEQEGWIKRKEGRIALSDLGKLFYDSVAEKLILC